MVLKLDTYQTIRFGNLSKLPKITFFIIKMNFTKRRLFGPVWMKYDLKCKILALFNFLIRLESIRLKGVIFAIFPFCPDIFTL